MSPNTISRTTLITLLLLLTLPLNAAVTKGQARVKVET